MGPMYIVGYEMSLEEFVKMSFDFKAKYLYAFKGIEYF